MPVGSKEMAVGSLVDRHLKESAKCRTVYEVAEEEKKKSNAARLFGGALTTAPQSKPDGGSSDCGTKASNKVNLGALESNPSSILAGFELLGQQMHLMHKEAMSRTGLPGEQVGQGNGQHAAANKKHAAAAAGAGAGAAEAAAAEAASSADGRDEP